MKKKAKKKKPNLSSEAALKRALDATEGLVRFYYWWNLEGDDVILSLYKNTSDTLLWQDSLRRLGITKRKPLRGVAKKLRRAIR